MLRHDLAEIALSRRAFLSGSSGFLGSLALGALADGERSEPPVPHFAPRAKRVICLFQSGAPSQLDLFDPKPRLTELDGQPMPDSLVAGAAVDQLAGRRLVIAGSRFAFSQHGASGLALSELLPHLGRVADRIAVIRSMHTDVINHDPALTMMMTGHPRAGRPCMGAWLSYGLGSMNRDLPAFVVLVSGNAPIANPLRAGLWGSAFLPGEHQGVKLRSAREPVLFLSNPAGIDRATRRNQLDHLRTLNELQQQATGDPATRTRIEAYELAFRMQTSVPELMDLKGEDPRTLRMYGAEPGQPSFAGNCLLARRLAERGVRFIQLCHRGWDHHYRLPQRIVQSAREVDRASAALIEDLERRGMLDETLVVWGGEFGRTPMNQGGMGGDRHGRDHHGKAFSMWLAGGGIKPGTVVGATDELGYGIVEDPVHVHDLHATLLHQLGIDHERLTCRHQGRDFRLTDVGGRVVRALIS